MSTFPTKIVLATDASEDAEKAAQMATDIANISGSELHVLHVGNTRDFHIAPGAEQTLSPRSGDYGEIRENAEKTLDEAVRQVEEAGGDRGAGAPEDGRPGQDTPVLRRAGRIRPPRYEEPGTGPP